MAKIIIPPERPAEALPPLEPLPLAKDEGSTVEDIIAEEPVLEADTDSLTLEEEDNMKRDWTRYNRKIGYIYPEVVLPSWRHRRSWER